MYVLDTNVISELRRVKRQQSETVRRWAAEQPLAVLYLSAVTVLELETGVLRMGRKDALQGAALRSWCDGVLREFEGRILAFDGATARRCATLQVPDARSFRDSMIAATALEHGFAVVTRNVQDFALTGAALLNPWE